jgi:hypothetical protein
VGAEGQPFPGFGFVDRIVKEEILHCINPLNIPMCRFVKQFEEVVLTGRETTRLPLM